MADAEQLSHAFMRAHPAEAARVLEAVTPEESAALFDRSPARLAQEVLSAMLPAAAARCLTRLGDERALALLAGVRRQPAVAILRQVPEPRRLALIAGLPTAQAIASRLLLGFPDDSVGAWCDPDVVALPGDTRADAALERVRAADAPVASVFVVGSAQELAGSLPLARLLRAPPATRLAALAEAARDPVAAGTPLASALEHPGWARSSLLPVVEAHGRLVGALARDALVRALRRRGSPLQPGHGDSVVAMLARTYWGALSGGIAALVLLLPPAGGRGNQGNGR